MRLPFEFPSPMLALLFSGAVKATLLLALAWIATASMRRAPAAARHLVWTLALVGAIGLPLASWLVPAWPLQWVPALTAGGANTPPPPSATLVLNESSSAQEIATEEPAESGTTPMVSDRSERRTDAAPEQTGSVLPRIDGRLVLSLLPVMWLAGAVVLLGRRAIAAIRVGRLARRALPLDDPAWKLALDRHAKGLGVGRTPELLVSAEADVPMTFGTLRPVILVPADASSWAAARRDFVLLHELGHIRRRDTLSQLAGQVAAALYWFHPLVWIAKSRQRAEAEHACDDQVLHSGALASAYARELLELATAARPHDTYGTAALAMARRSQLEGRLLTILDPRNARGAVGRRFVIGALLLTVAATTAIAAARPRRADAPVVAEVPGITPDNMPQPYRPDLLAQARVTDGPTPALAASDPADGPTVPPALAGPPAPAGPDADQRADAQAAPAVNADPVVVSSSITAGGAGGDEALAAALGNAVLAAATASSKSSGKSRSSFSIQDHDGDISANGNWIDDDGRSAKYRSKGNVRFNDALDDVASISAGGYLTVELEENGHRWRAEFKPQGGSVQRAYWVDADRAEWNDEAREWFQEFLIEADRRSAMLAKQRYPKLMAAGGANRVLDEIAKMPSDYARSTYYRMLVEDGLDRDDLRRVVSQAGRDVKSDYELSRILQAAAQKGALQDAQTRQAFLAAIGSIESDYEHARVMLVVLEGPKLDPALAADALASVANIKSDYERSRILVTMSEKGSVNPAIQREYIRTATVTRSDYEKARTLRSLVKNAEITDENVAPLLAAVSSIRSDYEKAGVLVAIAESVALDRTSRAAFIETAETIRSDYERKRALSALGERSASY